MGSLFKSLFTDWFLLSGQAKDSWEMNTDEKLEQGSIAKEKGTQCFKVGVILDFIGLL